MKYEYNNIKFKNLLIDIKNYFNQDTNKVLFEKRNIIKILNYKNNDYVIKSFKIPHLLNKVVYKFFRDSKAKRSYHNSLKLKNLNINTPEPIGYVEFSSFLFFQESFYVSDFFKYDYEIRDVLNDKSFLNRDLIFEKFIEFTFNLHNKGVYHIDYSPGNILIKEKEDEYIFSIIDVNRMKFLEFDIDLRMKSIAKLTNNNRDNTFFVNYYSKISKLDFNQLNEKMNLYVSKHQQYIVNKKRIKNK